MFISVAWAKDIIRVTRQRRVYALLSEEMSERIHALQLKTLTPDEDAGQKKSPAET